MSFGFYGVPCRDLLGRATRPPRKKQEVGDREKQMAGDPASPYKRAGVSHFQRRRVVVFVVFFCLVRCRLNNSSSPLSILDIRTLPTSNRFFLLPFPSTLFFFRTDTRNENVSVNEKASITRSRIRSAGRRVTGSDRVRSRQVALQVLLRRTTLSPRPRANPAWPALGALVNNYIR